MVSTGRARTHLVNRSVLLFTEGARGAKGSSGAFLLYSTALFGEHAGAKYTTEAGKAALLFYPFFAPASAPTPRYFSTKSSTFLSYVV